MNGVEHISFLGCKKELEVQWEIMPFLKHFRWARNHPWPFLSIDWTKALRWVSSSDAVSLRSHHGFLNRNILSVCGGTHFILNLRPNHVSHNVNCPCLQEWPAVGFYKRLKIVQHTWSQVDERDFSSEAILVSREYTTCITTTSILNFWTTIFIQYNYSFSTVPLSAFQNSLKPSEHLLRRLPSPYYRKVFPASQSYGLRA